MKTELADYIAAAESVVESVNPLEWWKAKEENNTLLKWVQAFKLVLLVQPSSGAAECVFSLLNNSFNARQESAMEDYIELSVMMQYNKMITLTSSCMYYIRVTFYFDGKLTMINLRKFRAIYGKCRKIYGKYREEMWEKKKRNLGEFLSILCQGLVATLAQNIDTIP